MDTQNKVSESVSSTEIERWLTTYLSELLDISQDEVDMQATFDSHGLDSAAAIGLTGELADWLAIDLEPTLLYEHPSIQKLANFLAGELNAEK
ncbi:acyl carrier protein [Stenomitos frigidus]|uniref:Phosphopantetheine-binding protein n=1 Tax=Stenomitos frigidus ULC18 TaxID=2107698 RepID=A0A2T1DWX6_9CYAN|nr:acyl carrier protein [Stenomitos frigidus]PSB25006.1 phosphopantetheine-binding protein [Stenomitos frigidus ULC18]